jgi:hypothetical protein
MVRMATKNPDEIPPPRDVVTLQDALNAIMAVAAVIDEATQAGRIPVDRGVEAAAMLMVARDYIQPLPRGQAYEGAPDEVTPDLQEMVTQLCATVEDAGI